MRPLAGVRLSSRYESVCLFVSVPYSVYSSCWLCSLVAPSLRCSSLQSSPLAARGTASHTRCYENNLSACFWSGLFGCVDMSSLPESLAGDSVEGNASISSCLPSMTRSSATVVSLVAVVSGGLWRSCDGEHCACVLACSEPLGWIGTPS